jgi:tRNA(fMet)-specific endonuclease VapC
MPVSGFSTEPLTLAERLRFIPRTQVRLSSVVKGELLYGARKSGRIAENLRLLGRFFETIASLPFDDRCAEEYGVLREELERAGTLIRPNDLLIAASARAHGAILVTNNIREFSRVPELRIDDWESQ